MKKVAKLSIIVEQNTEQVYGDTLISTTVTINEVPLTLNTRIYMADDQRKSYALKKHEFWMERAIGQAIRADFRELPDEV